MCRQLLCYYGYDPRSLLGGRYPESVRWTALLNAANWDVINRGENGRSIPRLDWEIETAVQTVRGIETDIFFVYTSAIRRLFVMGLFFVSAAQFLRWPVRWQVKYSESSGEVLIQWCAYFFGLSNLRFWHISPL